MSELSDDIARGCLENGEPIEARWGTGEWSVEAQENTYPQPEGDYCPYCGEMAWFFMGQFVECPSCGRKAADDEATK